MHGGATRRQFLGAAAATALLAGCGGNSSAGSRSSSVGGGSTSAFVSAARTAKGGHLSIYSFPEYFAIENIAAFTKQTGVHVRLSTYDDNNTLVTQLGSAGGGAYDIAIPTSGWVPELAQRGLLHKLDHSRIPFATIDPNLLDKNYDPGNQYSIPKDWGVFGVAYDPGAVGGKIKTWQDFLDAGTKPGVSGKVAVSNSGYETVATAIWAQGGDWNTTDTSVIQRAGATMKAFAKHVGSFNCIPSVIAKGTIVLAQCNQSTARSAILLNPKLEFVIPGPTSELWVDNYVIPSGAPDLDQAYAFLDFELEPSRQVIDTEYIGFPTAVKNLQQLLPPSTKLRSLIFGGPGAALSKLTPFIVNPKTIQLYNQLQNEIQAAASARNHKPE
jgi:spermidine/putrescine transport system substrate-binding protein